MAGLEWQEPGGKRIKPEEERAEEEEGLEAGVAAKMKVWDFPKGVAAAQGAWSTARVGQRTRWNGETHINKTNGI